MRWLVFLAGLAGAIVLLAVAVLQHSLPEDPASSRGQIEGRVDIHYDGFRRPYVQAQGVEDALYAQGWLHARERLWQMELLRRAGGGRLAAALGASMVATDRELWTVGVPQLAERLEKFASPHTRALVEAYVSGANHGIETLTARPPELLLAGIELEPWTASDVFAIGALTAFESGRNYRNELLRLTLRSAVDAERFLVFVPDGSDPQTPHVVGQQSLLGALARSGKLVAARTPLFAAPAFGSNGWAVSPSRSEAGVALWAFDSHDGFSMPNLLYEVHLFFGERSIRGWSVPGLPGVINGFNQHLAWGFTNIGDTQDLFVETRDGDRFVGPNGYYAARYEIHTIDVAGGEPVTFTVTHSRHGPLISTAPNIALRWSGHHTGALGLDGYFEMNLATSLDTFSAAMDRFAAPSANVTYADKAGHVAVRTVGLIPKRRSGSGLVPQRGDAAEAGWEGFVPMGALPRAVDPPDGFVAAANARVHADVPLISADNAPGYRMQRLVSRLSADAPLTLDDMRALQLDPFNGQAVRLLPHMLPAVGGDEVLQAYLQDPSLTSGSEAAVLFEWWYVTLARNVFGAALSEEVLEALMGASYVLNHALDRLIRTDHDSPWWRGDRVGILRSSLDEARTLAAGMQLGDVQTLRFRHEMSGAFPLASKLFDREVQGTGGGNASLLRARHRYTRPFQVTGGATVRAVLAMGSTIVGGSIIPGGQSGHPLSPHYDDQLAPYLAGDYLPFAASPESAGPLATRLEPQY